MLSWRRCERGRLGADAAVFVEGLTRRFGDFVAVDGVSFEIGRGEVFGLLGANGAGKTTIIRMLCCDLSPERGACTRARVRHARAARADPRTRRLHVAAVLALRRPDRRGEPAASIAPSTVARAAARSIRSCEQVGLTPRAAADARRCAADRDPPTRRARGRDRPRSASYCSSTSRPVASTPARACSLLGADRGARPAGYRPCS